MPASCYSQGRWNVHYKTYCLQFCFGQHLNYRHSVNCKQHLELTFLFHHMAWHVSSVPCLRSIPRQCLKCLMSSWPDYDSSHLRFWLVSSSLLSPVIGQWSLETRWSGDAVTLLRVSRTIFEQREAQSWEVRSVKCDPISHRGAIIREKVGDIRTINRLIWPEIRTDTSELQSCKCSLRIAKKMQMTFQCTSTLALLLLLLYFTTLKTSAALQTWTLPTTQVRLDKSVRIERNFRFVICDA